MLNNILSLLVEYLLHCEMMWSIVIIVPHVSYDGGFFVEVALRNFSMSDPQS